MTKNTYTKDATFDDNIEEYMRERVDDQIKWYDQKAMSYKKCSNLVSYTSISISSLATLFVVLPFITNWDENFITIVSLLGNIFVVIVLSIGKIKQFDSLHSTYRMTCEKLKSEKYLFKTKSGEYDGDRKDRQSSKLFVSRIESILATEVGNWAQLNERKSEN